MSIQKLHTNKAKEELLMDIFKMLATDLPKEGMRFIETDNYMSLKKADYNDDLLNAA